MLRTTAPRITGRRGMRGDFNFWSILGFWEESHKLPFSAFHSFLAPSFAFLSPELIHVLTRFQKQQRVSAAVRDVASIPSLARRAARRSCHLSSWPEARPPSLRRSRHHGGRWLLRLGWRWHLGCRARPLPEEVRRGVCGDEIMRRKEARSVYRAPQQASHLLLLS